MRGGKLSVPRVVLVLLTVAVVVVPVVAASSSAVSFSLFNRGWDGSSELRAVADETGTRVVVARETTAYRETRPRETVAFVLSPESSYGSREAARVTEFVRQGGTLVVADDVGPHGNDLLRALGASARIDGRPLRDPRSNYRSAALPVATGVANRSLTAGVESLTLNYGTAVEPGNATTLVNSSEYAYLDADRDGELGPNESLARHPVATVESVGQGRVVVVGDPSAFVNAMLDRAGNRRFARNLLARHSTLLLDYSNASGIPPVKFAVLAVRDSAVLQLGIAALVVAVLGWWSRRPRRDSGSGSDSGIGSDLLASLSLPWRTDDFEAEDVRASATDLASHLERRHPDWDRERVERVVSALERRRNR